eukprot:m.171613 g.171613  ORF g.171613 m.171613 type:complete len:385 (+) comp14555_c1_seq1:198-1352(+)
MEEVDEGEFGEVVWAEAVSGEVNGGDTFSEKDFNGEQEVEATKDIQEGRQDGFGPGVASGPTLPTQSLDSLLEKWLATSLGGTCAVGEAATMYHEPSSERDYVAVLAAFNTAVAPFAQLQAPEYFDWRKSDTCKSLLDSVSIDTDGVGLGSDGVAASNSFRAESASSQDAEGEQDIAFKPFAVGTMDSVSDFGEAVGGLFRRAGTAVVSGAEGATGSIVGAFSRLWSTPTTDTLQSEPSPLLSRDIQKTFDETMLELQESLRRELTTQSAQQSEHNIDFFVRRFEEEMAVERKLREDARLMELENEQVLLHQHMWELEAQEAREHPEPPDVQPVLSDGDDSFTQRMKQEGLVHVTGCGATRTLTKQDLPPEFDLSAFAASSEHQ